MNKFEKIDKNGNIIRKISFRNSLKGYDKVDEFNWNDYIDKNYYINKFINDTKNNGLNIKFKKIGLDSYYYENTIFKLEIEKDEIKFEIKNLNNSDVRFKYISSNYFTEKLDFKKDKYIIPDSFYDKLKIQFINETDLCLVCYNIYDIFTNIDIKTCHMRKYIVMEVSNKKFK